MDRENFINEMKQRKFGIELEFTGRRRSFIERKLKEEGLLDDDLRDSKLRKWKLIYDGSITAVRWRNGQYESTYEDNFKAELVTPILEYDDIPFLQDIISFLRRNRCISSSGYMCGLHIHIDDTGFNEDSLRNLIRLMASKEKLLVNALQIPDDRLNRYCSYVDDEIKRRARRKYRTIRQLEESWSYYSSRYRMLNLDSLFVGKGIEYRMFNGTMNDLEVKAYIQFALALTQSALSLDRCSMNKPTNITNDKYAMRLWLNRMNLIGDEFKDCRRYMTKALSGDGAFADRNRRKFGVITDFSTEELPYLF